VVQHVTGPILWSNLNLLFWMSLVPFATGWMGQNQYAPMPTALYGLVLLMPALSWHAMQWAIIRSQGKSSLLAQAIGRDLKGKLTPFVYVLGMALAFVDTRLANAMYLLVAIIWLVPAPRIEKALDQNGSLIPRC
jgi:uncharacterized membrane protein